MEITCGRETNKSVNFLPTTRTSGTETDAQTTVATGETTNDYCSTTGSVFFTNERTTIIRNMHLRRPLYTETSSSRSCTARNSSQLSRNASVNAFGLVVHHDDLARVQLTASSSVF